MDFNNKFNAILQNPAFMLGSGILGNNTGHYGQFGPALSGGLNNFYQQQAFIQNQKRQAEQQQFMNNYRQQQMANEQLKNNMAQQQWDQQQKDKEAIYSYTGGVPLDIWKYQNQEVKLPTGMRQGKNGPEWIPNYLEGKSKVAKQGAPVVNNFMTGKLSPGQKKLDETFAQTIAEYDYGGGSADTGKNIGQLKEVQGKLKTQDDLTGPIVGNLPEWTAAVVAPESVDTREAVEEVVQRNLRLILGAQFTNEEGKRLIARAYNPKLEEKYNKKRIDRLITAIEKAHEQKRMASEYFKANGTMRGYKGKIPTLDDFYQAIEETENNDPLGLR